MEFSKFFKNEFVVMFASFVLFWLVGTIFQALWLLFFSIILSFVLSDVLLNIFIHGGEGHAKIFSGNKFACKGDAFSVFFVGIIVGTIVSTVIVELLMTYFKSQLTWDMILFFTDLIVVLAVYGDLEWRFYSR